MMSNVDVFNSFVKMNVADFVNVALTIECDDDNDTKLFAHLTIDGESACIIRKYPLEQLLDRVGALTAASELARMASNDLSVSRERRKELREWADEADAELFDCMFVEDDSASEDDEDDAFNVRVEREELGLLEKAAEMGGEYVDDFIIRHALFAATERLHG